MTVISTNQRTTSTISWLACGLSFFGGFAAAHWSNSRAGADTDPTKTAVQSAEQDSEGLPNETFQRARIHVPVDEGAQQRVSDLEQRVESSEQLTLPRVEYTPDDVEAMKERIHDLERRLHRLSEWVEFRIGPVRYVEPIEWLNLEP